MKTFREFLFEGSTGSTGPQGSTGSPAPRPHAITGGMLTPPIPGSKQTPWPTPVPIPPSGIKPEQVIPGYGKDMWYYDPNTKTWKIGG
jgi:hypothetical protein